MTNQKRDTLFGEATDISRALDETVLETRLLNDDLRIRRLGGTIVITTGIASLGPSAIRDIISAITALVSLARTIPMASTIARS